MEAMVAKSSLPATSTSAILDKVVSSDQLIKTQVSYLIRDSKHEHEKPYTINFDTGGALPHTNTSNEMKPIGVRNFRPLQNDTSFETYGFTTARLDMAQEVNFEIDEEVKKYYYPAIRKVLDRTFPEASAIEILEHGLRKRHQQFPIATGEEYEYFQPATLVHTDFTPYSAARTAQAAFDRPPESYRRLIAVNLWKRTSGPGNDWPLALCDWRTIDRSGSETIMADVVFHDRFTENERVYYSPKHEWYYFKDLGEDEVIVFRQTDTDLEGGGGVMHSSFYNSFAAKDAAPRESVELRAFILYA